MAAWWLSTEEPTSRILAAFQDVQNWRSAHSYPLSLVTPGLRNWVSQISGTIDVAQRLKRTPQIITKLTRFPSMRLPQMEDIAGCRGIVSTMGEADAVAARIDQYWNVHHVNDYREAGKPGTGYRALHYVVERRGVFVEVQLRTRGQHRWAEEIERAQDRTGFALKDGQGPAELLEYFRVASDIIWIREAGLPDDEGLVAELSKLRVEVLPYFRPDE
jgi:hypothetical protein